MEVYLSKLFYRVSFITYVAMLPLIRGPPPASFTDSVRLWSVIVILLFVVTRVIRGFMYHATQKFHCRIIRIW